MRLASWNINGLRARFDFIRIWLEDRRPDIVGLQELKTPEEEFPHLALQDLGYEALVYGQKAWNGVAILSREPMELVQAGLPGEEEFGARWICSRLDDLTIGTVYCPNGKSVEHADYPRKLAWFDSLSEALGEVVDIDSPALVGGDFNICPQPIDSWNEEKLAGRIFHTEAERAKIERLADAGWVDLFRQRYPDEQKFSWWDYRAGAFHRNHGLRIDLMLGTSALAERVEDVWIDRDYRKKQEGMTASDHAPVVVDLE